MHLENGITGANRIKATIVTDLEGGADYQIAKRLFPGDDYELVVSGQGRSLDELSEHVQQRDPVDSPGVIEVDRGIKVIVKAIGENAVGRKPELYDGPIEIIELPARPADLAR